MRTVLCIIYTIRLMSYLVSLFNNVAQKLFLSQHIMLNNGNCRLLTKVYDFYGIYLLAVI